MDGAARRPFLAFVEALASPFQIEGFFAVLCLAFVALFVLFVVAGIWVYRDAESRAMDGTLWALGVVIGGLLGGIIGIVVLIVYLVVRSDHPVGGYRYPVYGPYPAGAYGPPGYAPPGAYGPPPPGAPPVAAPAPPTGTPFPPGPSTSPTSVTCAKCGTAIPAGAGFCPNCGTKV